MKNALNAHSANAKRNWYQELPLVTFELRKNSDHYAFPAHLVYVSQISLPGDMITEHTVEAPAKPRYYYCD